MLGEDVGGAGGGDDAERAADAVEDAAGVLLGQVADGDDGDVVVAGGLGEIGKRAVEAAGLDHGVERVEDEQAWM